MSDEITEGEKVGLIAFGSILLVVLSALAVELLRVISDSIDVILTASRPVVNYLATTDVIVLTIPLTGDVLFGVIAGIVLVFALDWIVNRAKEVVGR